MTSVDETEHLSRRHEVAARFGAMLRATRLTQGISQERVALDAGLAVFTYSALERAESATGTIANPTLDTILRVCEALDLVPLGVAQATRTDVQKPVLSPL